MALRDRRSTPEEVQAATEQTSARKLREMRLALDVERKLNKTADPGALPQLAYFGHRAYGIYAASEVFFSKKPADLTLTEAATLAGWSRRRPTYDPAGSDQKAATDRRNYVIDRMVDLGLRVARRGADAAKAQPIQLHLTNPPNDCVASRRAQRLGLLLRLLQDVVDRPAGVRGQPAGTDGQAAPRRVPDRHHHRSRAPGQRARST